MCVLQLSPDISRRCSLFSIVIAAGRRPRQDFSRWRASETTVATAAAVKIMGIQSCITAPVVTAMRERSDDYLSPMARAVYEGQIESAKSATSTKKGNNGSSLRGRVVDHSAVKRSYNTAMREASEVR